MTVGIVEKFVRVEEEQPPLDVRSAGMRAAATVDLLRDRKSLRCGTGGSMKKYCHRKTCPMCVALATN